jgi:flagellar protein FlbD
MTAMMGEEKLGEWKEAFPDAKGTVTNAAVADDTVTLEVTWEGTQDGPLAADGHLETHTDRASTTRPAHGGAGMILVHRLRGEPLYVNADLIETVESTPDTVLSLVDGRRLMVEETPETVVERFTVYRASLLLTADELRVTGPTLSVVPDEEA